MNFLSNNFLIILIVYVLKFLFLEIKLFKSRFNKLKKFIRKISIIKLIIYFFDKETLPFRDKNLNEYLKKNKKLWSNNKGINTKKENILVDLTFEHHPLYAINNCLIVQELKKYCNSRTFAIINKYDLLTVFIARSFHVEHIIFYKNKNFFIKFFYFIKTIFILQKIKDVKNIINYKKDNIEIGKACFEHYIRNYTRKSSVYNKKNFLLYLSFSKALMDLDRITNIYKKNNFKYFVIAELQFLPNKIFFQKALKSKTLVFAKLAGGLFGFSVRIYKNFKDRNSFKHKFSSEFINFLLKNYKTLLLKKIQKLSKNLKLEKNIGYDQGYGKFQQKKKILNFKNKKELDNFFNFDNNKKNILIAPHVMIDNTFNSEWSVYGSPLHWYEETLKIIKNIKDVNWIIKPHPAEISYRTQITAQTIFDREIGNSENIAILSTSQHINKLHQFISSALTCHGSAGFEYTTLGVPVVTGSDAKFSNFKFTIAPKSKKEYLKTLKNIKNLQRTNKKQKFMARLYWFLENELCKLNHNLLIKFDAVRFFDEKKFWFNCNKITNKKNLKNDFVENFKNQFKNDNRHTFNYKILDKRNTFKNQKFDDI